MALHRHMNDNRIKAGGREISYSENNFFQTHTCMLHTVVVFKNGIHQRIDLHGCQKPRNSYIIILLVRK